MVEMSLKVDRNTFDYEGLTQTQWALKQAYLMGYRFDFNTQELELISFNKLYIEKCLQYGLEPKRFRCDGSIRERDYELEILKKVL